MRSVISLLVVALIALGSYFYFLKRSAPAGMVATQAISTTGVQMDLTAIAQAERSYFTQNGGYATIEQLTSSGALTGNTARDGYTYSIEVAPGGFTAVARHPDVTPPDGLANGAAAIHYPVISVDQSMQIQESQ